MFCTIINDCKDQNAMGRQATRAAAILGCQIITVGVDSDLEAAGNLVDILDSAGGERGIILVNVAHREKEGKKWPNGTPFGYFHYKNTLVVSSIDGLSLSLVKKLKVTTQIHLMDIPIVLQALLEQGLVDKGLVAQITNTQFRSFEFLPRVAGWITEGYDVPFEKFPIEKVKEVPSVVWWVDNFGNCKTTLLPEEVQFKKGEKLSLKIGEFETYNRLKDVPDNKQALIIGSSGLQEKRFLEIVIQGNSAANKFNLHTGAKV